MKQRLQVFAAKAAEWTPDGLMVFGAAAVAYGAGQIYAPAGWLVAGTLAIVAGVLMARGRS